MDSLLRPCTHQLALNSMDPTSHYEITVASATNAGKGAAGRDSLLVVIGSSEYDIDLIHAAKRLTEALQATWTVVNLQVSAFRFTPDRDRDRRWRLSALPNPSAPRLSRCRHPA